MRPGIQTSIGSDLTSRRIGIERDHVEEVGGLFGAGAAQGEEVVGAPIQPSGFGSCRGRRWRSDRFRPGGSA